MRLNLLPVVIALVALSSCSTAYKSGQTPDDLYYSPSKENAGAPYTRATRQREDSYSGDDDYYEDRYLHMRVQNPNRWSPLDDYYFNNPYAYNYYGGSYLGMGFNNPWNSYYLWNNYYNPYASLGFGYGGYYGGGYYAGGGYYGGGYGGGYYGGGGHAINVRPPARPVVFNPSSYSNGNSGRAGTNSARSSSRSYINNNNGARYNNSNGNYSTGGRTNGGGNGGRYNGSNSGNNSGRSYNNSGNDNTPSRSYNPPSSNNSGGGSRSTPPPSNSGGGGNTRPPR